MDELAPGLWHWTALHPRIKSTVSSYYLFDERVAIDPMVPPDAGLDWFERHQPPLDVVLTNRHHDRDSWQFKEAFGCTIHCIRNGVHEIEDRGPVEAFEFGDELPGGIIAHQVGSICPDETALHLPSHRALACADGVVRLREDGQLGFVPEHLMDDPEQTKKGLLEAYERLLDLDFDALLLAHGEPIASGGKQALREFVQAAG